MEGTGRSIDLGDVGSRRHPANGCTGDGRTLGVYHTGLDPFSQEPVYTAKALREKRLQKALLQYWDVKQHHLAREALKKAKRYDLIGSRPGCLVPPERVYLVEVEVGALGGVGPISTELLLSAD